MSVVPWQEYTVEEDRLRFVVRLMDGEEMSLLCREFGISRKTGYKIFSRYKECGHEAFTDRPRRPIRFANQLPLPVELAILELKKEKPHWGAKKLRERFIRKFGSEIPAPAVSTFHAVLHRHGLVQPMNPRRNRAMGTPLSTGQNPNDLWCVDYKGEFRLGNEKYCYPLTVTDHASRYLLLCEAFESTQEVYAFTAFDWLFKERGLPDAIRSDNGVPFACPSALFQLSKLSVWWLRLGIDIERIKPGCPQQNGRHERMHLTLKKQTTRPAKANSLQQQAVFDEFALEFNNERPHEALGMKFPAECYTPSTKKYDGLPQLEYPFHDRTVTVTPYGKICMLGEKIYLSQVFSGQTLGLKEVEENTWLVSFMNYDLGYIDLESKNIKQLDNPFQNRKV